MKEGRLGLGCREKHTAQNIFEERLTLVKLDHFPVARFTGVHPGGYSPSECMGVHWPKHFTGEDNTARLSSATVWSWWSMQRIATHSTA